MPDNRDTLVDYRCYVGEWMPEVFGPAMHQYIRTWRSTQRVNDNKETNKNVQSTKKLEGEKRKFRTKSSCSLRRTKSHKPVHQEKRSERQKSKNDRKTGNK